MGTTTSTVSSQPVATAGAGTWLQQGNTLLSNAIDLWGQVEQVKAVRSSSGGDQTAALTQTDLENGAGVTVDTQVTTPTESASESVFPWGWFAVIGGGISAAILLKMALK